MTFIILELVQFFLGLFLVVLSFVLIIRHRKPLLDSYFGENVQVRESFETLTSAGYFMIFVPILLVGINIEPPVGQQISGQIQRIIYFEAGLIFLVGILHLGVTVIFSSMSKNTGTKERGD